MSKHCTESQKYGNWGLRRQTTFERALCSGGRGGRRRWTRDGIDRLTRGDSCSRGARPLIERDVCFSIHHHGNNNTSAIAYSREQWRPRSLHMPRNSSPDSSPTVCRPLSQCFFPSAPTMNPGMETTATTTSTTSTIPIYEQVKPLRPGRVR